MTEQGNQGGGAGAEVTGADAASPDVTGAGGATSRPVLTLGHGTLPTDDYLALVREAGVERVVDIRSYPGSRHNPQFGREQMAEWLPAAGLDYRWLRSLGGRRKPDPESPNVAWRNKAFQAYADHMNAPEFADGIAELLQLADDASTAIMCSETVWWRCHRRLVADHLTRVEGRPVLHLFHDGRLQPHPPNPTARRVAAGLVYDLDTTPRLPLRGDVAADGDDR